MPQITAIFWVVKILATGMGEATSDFLFHETDPPIAVALGLAIFAVATAAQFVALRYIV